MHSACRHERGVHCRQKVSGRWQTAWVLLVIPTHVESSNLLHTHSVRNPSLSTTNASFVKTSTSSSDARCRVNASRFDSRFSSTSRLWSMLPGSGCTKFGPLSPSRVVAAPTPVPGGNTNFAKPPRLATLTAAPELSSSAARLYDHISAPTLSRILSVISATCPLLAGFALRASAFFGRPIVRRQPVHYSFRRLVQSSAVVTPSRLWFGGKCAYFYF